MQYFTSPYSVAAGSHSQIKLESFGIGNINCFSNSDQAQYYRREWCPPGKQCDSATSENGMDTSPPSFENNTDSRKRPLDNESEKAIVKKYVGDNPTFEGENVYHMKLLVPTIAAGAIIGKGGETIAQLQREKRARVKISKTTDFYPGTTERVCIISSSSPDSIMAVISFIMDKIKEKPEVGKLVSQAAINESNSNAERDRQVKILVPNTTAGMIIGKGGSYVKSIKEQTGAFIQLSQKPKEVSLPERCITVSGSHETNLKVCEMILRKIVDDPQSGSCLNLSYADVAGPVANFNPTGSPYAVKSVNGIVAVANAGANYFNLNVNMPSINSAMDNALAATLVEQVNSLLRSNGFPEHSVGEVSSALNILAKYGMLGVGYGGNVVAKNINNLMNSPSEVPKFNANNTLSALTGPTIDLTAASALDIYQPNQTNVNNNNYLALAACAALTVNQPGDILSDRLNAGSEQIRKTELEIPDPVLTAIIGPSGRNLLEIQYRSGTIIQITSKGLFPVKTLTITGVSSSVTMAQCLIEQLIPKVERQPVSDAANPRSD